MKQKTNSGQIQVKLIEYRTAILGFITALLGLLAFFLKDDNTHITSKMPNGKPPIGADLNGNSYLFVIFILFGLLTIFFWVIANRERVKKEELEKFIKETTLSIGNRPISAVNATNLYRQYQNDDFKLSATTTTVTIEGLNANIEIESKGVRVDTKMSGYIFNISGDSHIQYQDMICFAYDLTHDPSKTHKIRPKLWSMDGPLKQVLIPFLNPVNVLQPFHVYIYWESPNSVGLGVDYHGISIFSDDELSNTSQKGILKFKQPFPKWVRVYEVIDSELQLIKELDKVKETKNVKTYVDEYPEKKIKKNIVYWFQR